MDEGIIDEDLPSDDPMKRQPCIKKDEFEATQKLLKSLNKTKIKMLTFQVKAS